MLDFPFDMLRQAIRVFLQSAYPAGDVPERVKQRIALDETKPVAALLGAPPFERSVAEAPFPCTVYALRLGSTDYPHIKLEIRPFPNRWGFVFWVNTHDQFFLSDEKYADAQRWRRLVDHNRELKQTIERAWADLRLPTFTTAMQESLGLSELREASGPVPPSYENA